MEKPARPGSNPGTPASDRPQLTLLRSDALEQMCVRGHFRPSPDLADFVAVAWTMQWNLEDGQSFTQQVLPNPSVQIVISGGQTEIFGIVTGAFSATFTGKTFVFALKFRPCGFHPFAGQPVSAFTDRRIPLIRILPEIREDVLHQTAVAGSSRELLHLLEHELRKALPQTADPTRQELEALILSMENDPGLLTVDDTARRYGVSTRTLQRLFREYVGVSPRWMIRRYRLKEAAARIEMGEQHDWAGLAGSLGYFDQSHLINDFKRMLGQAPATWLRSGTNDAGG